VQLLCEIITGELYGLSYIKLSRHLIRKFGSTRDTCHNSGSIWPGLLLPKTAEMVPSWNGKLHLIHWWKTLHGGSTKYYSKWPSLHSSRCL